MKRKIILPIIAIILLVVFVFLDASVGAVIFLLVLLLYFLNRYFTKRKDEQEENTVIPHLNLEDVIQRYGDPDDTIVLDASRANELQSLILFYKAIDKAFIAGKEIKISEITSVAPKNLAVPYTVDEWGVIINTNNKSYPVFRLRVGYDGGMASEIANQIYKNLV